MRAFLALLAALLPFAADAAPAQPFVRGSWGAVLAEHRGHPTIIHFWGVTCGPCLVELPQWAAFRADHPGVDLVMIEADPVAEAADNLATPLTKAGLSSVEKWNFADSFIERLEFEVDPQWQGELPFTVLVGGNGASTSVLGPADFSAMIEWLDRHSSS